MIFLFWSRSNVIAGCLALVTTAMMVLPNLSADDQVSAAVAEAIDSLQLLPGDCSLVGSAARQQLVVEAIRGDQFVGQIDDGVEWDTSNAQVARSESGVVVAMGNGVATITARVKGLSASINVTVSDFEKPVSWSFRNHVEPVLTKFGCNSGACHGALAGKKGFKLSLRGFDPDADHFVLTRQARGRRVSLADPARSLLLTKPTGALPHKGGVRFDVTSREYQVIAGWIAGGAAPPTESDARVVKLEILPPAVLLTPGGRQQFLVRAQMSDGQVVDVTRWAKFTASNDAVAQVDGVGHATAMGHGEGAISAWYMSQNVVATVSAPYEHPVSDDCFAGPTRNFIDGLVLAKLKSLRMPPSPDASDSEFLRRAYLDTIGVLPTAPEARAFLADNAPDKRDRLIEDLLARPEFVDYWSYKWSDLLLVSSERLPPPAMWSYYNWIRNSVAANKPWDEFAREIITANGSTLENGAGNFFVLHPDPPALAETTSVAFLGMSINCARCHNHPLEKWTNDQYYAMANLFSRVRTKDVAGEGHKMVFSVDAGELTQPRTGRPQPPTPLDGEPVAMDATTDRRRALADWLTSPRNPYFARAITNRVWANFFGVGLVEAVDDVRLTNPASNEPLLAAAAQHLIEHHFDLKALMRAILQSRAYQRSSRPLPENIADSRFYSRFYPRRIMAEVLLDAVSEVTGSPSEFAGYAVGWRAMQLPDANVNSYFLKAFGRPLRVLTCECERNSQPSMVQVLHISNGDTLNQKLSAKGNRVDALLASGASHEQIVEELYLAAYSRMPFPSEREQAIAALADPSEAEKRLLIEDLFWSILSSKEFLFNH